MSKEIIRVPQKAYLLHEDSICEGCLYQNDETACGNAGACHDENRDYIFVEKGDSLSPSSVEISLDLLDEIVTALSLGLVLAARNCAWDSADELVAIQKKIKAILEKGA